MLKSKRQFISSDDDNDSSIISRVGEDYAQLIISDGHNRVSLWYDYDHKSTKKDIDTLTKFINNFTETTKQSIDNYNPKDFEDDF